MVWANNVWFLKRIVDYKPSTLQLTVFTQSARLALPDCTGRERVPVSAFENRKVSDDVKRSPHVHFFGSRK